MGYEFELKFRANPEILEKMGRDFPADEVFRMRTTYYDTEDGALSEKRLTLRCRRENDISVCTLKTPTGGVGRGEFEIRCDSIEKAIPELCKLSGVELPHSGLVPVCGAEFTRQAKTLVLPDCTVELALDQGVLTGGGKEIPLFEVEVELKAGSQECAVAYAQALAAGYGLILETKSKFRRALDLAKGV